MKDYYQKAYDMSVQETNDELSVKKNPSSDWSIITMITNDAMKGMITIRSQAMAEQLHFMLGQMLNK